MIRNYIKTAFRNLWKDRNYSTINILGLAVGLASFITILLYLNHELSYDKWHSDLERVYKVSEQSDTDILQATRAPLAAFLKEQEPMVDQATRISGGGSYETLVSGGGKALYQTGIVEADSCFFEVFPYEIVTGSRAGVLQKPNAAVISEDLAANLFGKEDPIGKPIKLFNKVELEVTGVLREAKGPSQLRAKMVYRSPYEKSNTFWENYSYQTYIKTFGTVEPGPLERLLDQHFYEERLKEADLSYTDFKSRHSAGLFIDAIGDLRNFPKHGNSQIKTISVLLALATLLLFAGAINFSNLSIAAYGRRKKEVGVKKALGSTRGQLLRQFLGEISLQCLLALLLAFCFVSILLPYFNREFNLTLSLLGSSGNREIYLQVAFCVLVIILLCGLYPALYISRYSTTQVLKGETPGNWRISAFRNGLLIGQFVISAFFIIGTLVINKQLGYLQSRDKGFSGDQVIQIEATQNTREQDFDRMRRTLMAVAGVQNVGKSTAVPGNKIYQDTSTIGFNYAGNSYRMASVKVSAEYFNTLGIDLKQGRLFDERPVDQQTRSAIINESAANKLPVTDPIGAILNFPGCDSIPVQVVGVVADVNDLGFDQRVLPSIYTIGNEACMYQSGGAVFVKIDGPHSPETLQSITQAWKEIEPDYPIRFSFLDDNFQHLFTSYVRLKRVITFFGITAIAISAMGLFALTAFIIGRRSKEISIRKVLGASVSNLNWLLSKDFLLLIGLAAALAAPLAWWAADAWLNSFAYRISLNVWIFVAAAGIVVFIALATIAFQTVRAAKANPADSLRDE